MQQNKGIPHPILIMSNLKMGLRIGNGISPCFLALLQGRI